MSEDSSFDVVTVSHIQLRVAGVEAESSERSPQVTHSLGAPVGRSQPPQLSKRNLLFPVIVFVIAVGTNLTSRGPSLRNGIGGVMVRFKIHPMPHGIRGPIVHAVVNPRAEFSQHSQYEELHADQRREDGEQ